MSSDTNMTGEFTGRGGPIYRKLMKWSAKLFLWWMDDERVPEDDPPPPPEAVDVQDGIYDLMDAYELQLYVVPRARAALEVADMGVTDGKLQWSFIHKDRRDAQAYEDFRLRRCYARIEELLRTYNFSLHGFSPNPRSAPEVWIKHQRNWLLRIY